MGTKKIVAVVGATGVQGGGLARAILDDPRSEFVVRGLTRTPGGDRAAELAARGAEIVRADLDDPESLRDAFAGASSVYAVTNFWEHLSAEREKRQARNIAEAVRDAGVGHVIWSTLEDTRDFMTIGDARMPWLQREYRVPHIDAKAEANAYFAGLPVTYFLTTYYWDNLYLFGLGPTRGADGMLEWTLPMGESRLPGIAADDLGRIAYTIFRRGSDFIGRTVGVYSEALTVREMADALSRHLDLEPIRYNAIDPDRYRASGQPMADEVGNMFHVYRDFAPAIISARSRRLARDLNPQLKSFSDWIVAAKERILGVLAPASPALR